MCWWPRASSSALKAFRDGLAIAERLAKADPQNAGWQRDLSVSYDKVGDVLVAQGQLEGALKAFRDGLAIRDGSAKADPANTHGKWMSLFHIGGSAAMATNPKRIGGKWSTFCSASNDEGRRAPNRYKWLDKAKEELAALEN